MKIKEQLTIAPVQFDIRWESVDENLSKIESLVNQCQTDFDLLILPEAFTTGFSTASISLAEKPDGKTVQWMKKIAEQHNAAICGSIFINDKGLFFNRFLWVEPGGKVITYDKRHLFSMGGEDQLFSKGNQQVLIEYKGWKIFPQICYDLRFPVWSRNVSGYDLLINVANWPAARGEVWKTLLKARAIENQCYVAGINRIGTDGKGIEHAGDSKVIDPRGIKIFGAHPKEMIEAVSLDHEFLYKFRKKFNTLKDGDRFTLVE